VDDLLSEKEQIEQIRSWWSEYGSYVIGGIVIGAGILFGINYTQNAKLQAQLDASDRYEILTEHVADGKLDEAELLADEIVADYGNTSYAAQAGLAMARLYMDKNRDQDAADALAAVIDSDAGDSMRHVARLRLARIYLYQDKAQEVVDLLDDETDESFAPAYSEVLGDAYTALGRIEDAQAAYQKVLLNPLAQGTVDSQLVQWKALDLPEVPAVETEDAAAEEAVVPEGMAAEDAE
jgi:predicted negative regulator of RcsB-dependent stress response